MPRRARQFRIKHSFRRPFTLALSAWLGLQSSAPAFAADGDEVADAFKHLQKFAREAEEPASAPAPPPPPMTFARPSDDPNDELPVNLDQRGSIHVNHDYSNVLRKDEPAFLDELVEIFQAFDARAHEIQVDLVDKLFPLVTARLVTWERRPKVRLTISTGALAMIDNRDELTAVIAQALAREAPTVLAHRDDPRVTRRIEEQITFASLPEDARRMVHADLSAIERVKSAGRRPWALTDYEQRTFGFYRRDWSQGGGFVLSRWREKVDQSTTAFYEDGMLEVRLLAQKIAVTYLQERENIRDLIRTVHELPPPLKRIQQRARRHHSDALRPLMLLLKFGIAPLAVIGGTFSILIHSPLLSWIAHGAVGLWHLEAFEAVRLLIRAAFEAQQRAWAWENDVLLSVAAVVASAVGSVLGAILTVVSGVVGAVFAVLYSVLEACGLGFLAVWRPLAAAFVAYVWPIITTIGHAIAWTFDHFIDVITNPYLLLSFPIAFAAFGVYLLRAAIAEFAQARARNLYALGLFGLGFWNRWTRRSFMRDLFEKAELPATPRLYVSAADELARIFKQVGGRPHYEAIYQGPRGLRTLADGYMVPEDFWTMYKDFLGIVADRVDAGAITADALTEILTKLHPNEIPESERYDVLNHERVAVPFTLALSGLERDDVRPRLARLHDVARAHFPTSAPAAALKENATFAELNDTTIGPASVMGVARVASLVSDALALGRPEDLFQLQGLTFDRLRLFALSNDLSRAAYPNLVRAAAEKTMPADEIKSVFLQIQHVRQRRYPRGYANEMIQRGDGWSNFGYALIADEARALAAGNIGLATTLATWSRRVNVFFHDNHPPLKVAREFGTYVAVWPVLNIARHATEFMLRRELGRLDSVEALVDFVDRELLARGAFVDNLTPVLFHFVTTHPRLIRSDADVKALLDHDFFWPETPIKTKNIFRDRPGFFRGRWRRQQPLDENLIGALNAQKSRQPRSWKYQANLSEKLHDVIITRVRELGLMPQSYETLKEFWISLTDRGTTAVTDRLMQDVIAKARPREVEALRDLATAEGRVWETDLHSRMAITRAQGQFAYQALLKAGPGPRRAHLIDRVIGDLKASLPERGLAFAQFLEDLSLKINSSYEEARTLNAAKGDVSSAHAGDDNLRAVRDVFRQIAGWPRKDQFNFVKFLRGDERAGERLIAAFPRIGLERIRRMYEILPLAVRVGLFDTLFTHGLIGEGRPARVWTQALSRHIVGGDRTEAQKVTLQVLTAFLHAVREVGNAQMTTTILSYLYALPSAAASSPVEVLKLVLELFGATGIKVGQFTYASQILGEQGRVLRSLQSRARIPARIEMYEDVYDLLGVPLGTPLPFLVLELIGAASMKYAFMAQDRTNLAKLVVKVFRLDAMNNVDLQFDVLEHMTEYLVQHHGPRYGVFRIIIKSARLAVKREGSMRNEIRRSRIARHGIYHDRSDEDVRVEVPREDLVNPRMIIAQYAPGQAFDDLPAAAKPGFAKKLLKMEDDIYFADEDVIRFDPDRHAGNAQMRPNEEKPDDLGPIDFGQLLRMPRAQRERITKLFALAQIAGRVTVNAWVLDEIQSLLGLDETMRLELEKHLGPHLRAAGPRPVTLYVATLAALEASGFEIRDTTYIDFVRGIIQLTPFEPFAPEARAPSRSFERAVLTELKVYARAHRFDPSERAYITTVNWWRTLRGQTLLPTDLAEVNFDELIHREAAVHCDEALAPAI